jgi:hypothetical protein
MGDDFFQTVNKAPELLVCDASTAIPGGREFGIRERYCVGAGAILQSSLAASGLAGWECWLKCF